MPLAVIFLDACKCSCPLYAIYIFKTIRDAFQDISCFYLDVTADSVTICKVKVMQGAVGVVAR